MLTIFNGTDYSVAALAILWLSCWPGYLSSGLSCKRAIDEHVYKLQHRHHSDSWQFAVVVWAQNRRMQVLIINLCISLRKWLIIVHTSSSNRANAFKLHLANQTRGREEQTQIKLAPTTTSTGMQWTSQDNRTNLFSRQRHQRRQVYEGSRTWTQTRSDRQTNNNKIMKVIAFALGPTERASAVDSSPKIASKRN